MATTVSFLDKLQGGIYPHLPSTLQFLPASSSNPLNLISVHSTKRQQQETDSTQHSPKKTKEEHVIIMPQPAAGDHEDVESPEEEDHIEVGIPRGSSCSVIRKDMKVIRKRKRMSSKQCKNLVEAESQRMTHIAVERNRRKQMNEHLNALRDLMPPSFVQRGDQASIIGGAIDFVKELEQLLQSLQAQKSIRKLQPADNSPFPFHGFFACPQYKTYSSQLLMENINRINDDQNTISTSSDDNGVADIEVILIQTHANLKVLSPRKPAGQLVRAIVGLQGLDFAILHLNITAMDRWVLYSFNLKMEEECKLGTADEIATAVYQIFSYINRED